MTTPSSTELFKHTVQDELVSGFLKEPEPEVSSMPTETPWSPSEEVSDAPVDKDPGDN